ncbi:MAG: Radical SAM superfamily enzyme [Candidatus Methanohalarchaeum thermophilum]|uniref:Radical SAM superfamily enzyme n=1 Tax=Methanohalarchaeum thermophilum TaxID=1903181 RepID=A0A1Q6DXE5_METT1|nr:MAG: Radical SAM superfamily enzyme [Candidatus Methanohalarchaeum thermophilum]
MGFYWFREASDYSSEKKELEEALERYRFEKDIEYVYFNITEKCNANCPYCYVPEEKRKNGDSFTKEEFYDVLNKLSENNVNTVLFHGVEPLIEKNLIFEGIEDFPEFNYGIQTNGLQLEKDDIEYLKTKEVNFGVSLDAPKKKLNDYLRVNGHFENTLSILEEFKDYDTLNIITTINKFNEHLLVDMVKLLSEYTKTILMNPVRGTTEVGRRLRPNNLTENFLNAVERAMELTENGNKITIGDYANIVLGIIALTSRDLQCDISPCGAGRRFISITSNGIYPCTEFIGIEEFKTDLDKALNDDAFQDVISRKTEDIKECKNYEYRHLCGASCPAEVYESEETLNSKSPYCQFYKDIIDHAFKTIKQNRENLVINKENLSKTHEITKSLN